MRKLLTLPGGVLGLAILLASCSSQETSEQWLAGDHHIHSRYSVDWDHEVDPPTPIFDTSMPPIQTNAQMAKRYGLTWMVSTDHGGRLHAKLNLEQAYPDVLKSRQAVPDVIQFFGFELNTPGADHASVIVPQTHDEADRVYQLESQFDKSGADPDDQGADTVGRMIEALEIMRDLPAPPVVIANHPSRGAVGGKVYGKTVPEDLRAWNNAAPEVAVGMAGAPGHQAEPINADGSMNPDQSRGSYSGQPTYGGFDRLTAELGGFWDSMLGEGRRWWITANSDSHRNWVDGGDDFWPGEFSKTYVYAERDHDSVLAALRAGKVFVTTGDLVSELYVSVATEAGHTAAIGGTLQIRAGEIATVTIRLRDPDGKNSHGDRPTVSRVDLIAGDSAGTQAGANPNRNPSARIIRRFSAGDWTREGEFLTMTERLQDADRDLYLRVRGTNGNQLEPDPDPSGEDPWNDLWFYSNPVFLLVE